MDSLSVDLNTTQYCFPSNNLSCPKETRSKLQCVTLYLVLTAISVSTVYLNLLVIISISYYKQLHTPTNMFLLSLAVADFCVGLIVMPVEIVRVIDNCWYFGIIFCSLYLCVNFLFSCSALCSLVFIAIDRYIAVNSPLQYPLRVTMRRTVFCICLGWYCSVIYSFSITHNNLTEPIVHKYCFGHCTFTMRYTEAVLDIFITFIGPCAAIISLYIRVFIVARKQVLLIAASTAHSMKLHTAAGVSKKSELKAAKTLGLVVVLYLLCWIPMYLYLATSKNITSSSVTVNVVLWFAYCNSSINPIIYALFYPWFRRSVQGLMAGRRNRASICNTF